MARLFFILEANLSHLLSVTCHVICIYQPLVFHITIVASDGNSYILDDNMTLHDIHRRFVTNVGAAASTASSSATELNHGQSEDKRKGDTTAVLNSGWQMQLFYRLAPEAVVPYRLALEKWRASGSVS